MKPTEHDRIEHLVNQAMELKPAERPVFLLGACGQDADLRQQVETLLRASEEAEGFMEGVTTFDDSSMTEGPGTIVGRYKLLQKVGEGGMGAVYMAEQTEPVTRKVALKIIKLGMDTKQVVARFEAERQALAMMDHPHIAKVLDAGATDTGRPFFVMELVRGLPITEYCDKNKLSTQQRLELFIPVCQAIQHAHQKGIIHRDIKPSNVMVTLNDGSPHPMVIDFGIAKATHQKLTEKTLFTNYSQMIGTPAYMSPEQAEMSKLDVDTRTDVYSLGVLLYELLTGTTPFPTKELMSLGYGGMQRIIAEKEPPKPSTRMSTMEGEQRTAIAKNHSMDVSALGRLFKGDLDWIVMKALEKDRSHRYETVNALVADVRRHLANEPVSAAAPNFSYQWQKFYRRNRKQIHVGLAVILGLVCLGGFGMFQAIKAQQEQLRSEELGEFALKFINDISPQMEGNSKLRTILGNLETLVETGLTNSPVTELKIRHHIAHQLRLLKSYNEAAEKTDPLLTLLNRIPLNDLSLHDRFEYELEIAKLNLLTHPIDSPEARYEIENIKSLIDQWGKEPEYDIDVSMAHIELANYYFTIADFEKMEESLIDALACIEEPSGSASYAVVVGGCWGLPVLGHEPEKLKQKLKGMPELQLQSGHSDDYLDTFYNGFVKRFRLLTEVELNIGKARELVDSNEKSLKEAGKWGETFEDLREMFLVKLAMMEGDWETVSKYVSEQSNRPLSDLNINSWKMASMAAALVKDKEFFDKLRNRGIIQFAALDDQDSAPEVINTVLLMPVSEEMLHLVKVLIDRWKERSRQIEHFANQDEMIAYSEAMFAYRSGNYEQALHDLERHFQLKYDFPILRLVEFVMSKNWDSWALKSMILAKLDDEEASMQAYEKAKSLRPNRKGYTSCMDITTSDMWFREAEELLIENGWLDPEDAMAAVSRSIRR